MCHDVTHDKGKRPFDSKLKGNGPLHEGSQDAGSLSWLVLLHPWSGKKMINAAALPHSCFYWVLAHGIGLSTSVTLTQNPPHRHAQRFVFMVILNPTK